MASIGKTAAALVVGAAVRHGLVDINKPLAEYGVRPPKHVASRWAAGDGKKDSELGATSKDWEEVTARHVLAHVTVRRCTLNTSG